MFQSNDYPAAHSMDTHWFAVDRDGNLAYFDSGEEAAVPREIFDPDQGLDVLEGIMIRAPWMLLENARERHLIEPGSPQWNVFLTNRDNFKITQPKTFLDCIKNWFKPPVSHVGTAWFCHLIMLLKDTAILKQLDVHARWGEPLDVDGNRLTPVLFGLPSEDDYLRIHEAGACMACAGRVSFYRSDDEIMTLGSSGIFIYETREYGNPPYEMISRPQRPLRLDDLPVDLRSRAALVRFADLSFSDTEHLQPLEHVPCKTYENGPDITYLASDLKTRRPLPP